MERLSHTGVSMEEAPSIAARHTAAEPVDLHRTPALTERQRITARRSSPRTLTVVSVQQVLLATGGHFLLATNSDAGQADPKT